MADISIIIPAYNEARDLPNLIKSIEQEMRKDVEIVVVDNGSTDGTGEIAKQLGCRVLETPNKMFPSAARNYGARYCQSPLFVFLDADVIVTRKWAREVERLAGDQAFLEGYSMTGESCHISVEPSWIEKLWFEPLRNNGRSFVNGANMVISRKAFEKTGGFNAALETGEDVEFCVRAMQLGVELSLNHDLVVHHEGFPKDLKSFFNREKWHGVGDFSSFSFFKRSKVAQVVAAIGLCYLLILIMLPLAAYDLWDHTNLLIASCLTLILSACGVSSLAKFRKAGPAHCAAGVFIYFVYFNARLMSLFQSLRSRNWATPVPALDENSAAELAGDLSRNG